MTTTDISGLDIEIDKPTLEGFYDYLKAEIAETVTLPLRLDEWLEYQHEAYLKQFSDSEKKAPQCSGGVCTTTFPSSHIVEYSEIE